MTALHESEAMLPASDVDPMLQRSLVVGIVALGLCGLGAAASPEQFFRSYLLAYLFWFSIALGCLPIMMLHHQSGGAWGLAIRRVLEAGTRTLPMMAILFLPVALGLSHLYLWAQPDKVAADELLRHKSAYLNVPFFLGRAAVYFAVWITLAHLLSKWSLQQDRGGPVGLARRMQLVSGPGIALYGLTMTFASVDWVMSLDPRWFSTIFGMLMIAGQGLAALAFTIAVLAALSGRKPLAEVLRPDVFHDLGKLLLAFVMVWAYLSFSQFLIIWAGNLPEEIPWYLERFRGGWRWIGLALLAFQFLLPFVLLLSRDLKRNARRLAGIAAGVVAVRFIDVVWLVVPSFQSEGFRLHWMDLAAPIGLGGIWLAMFLRQLKGRALLPIRDPYLSEAFGHGRE